MDTLIQAQIFFFITSIFVVVLIIGSAVMFCYIIPILKDMKHISELARAEAETIADDIHALRAAAHTGSMKVKTIFDFFLALFIKREKSGRKRKVLKEEE